MTELHLPPGSATRAHGSLGFLTRLLHLLGSVTRGRRLLGGAFLLSLVSTPLGVALAHERLRPALDEAARASSALMDTLSGAAPRAHSLTLNGLRVPIANAVTELRPRAAAERVARACGEQKCGLGAALGSDRSAVGVCVALDSQLSPAATVTFARPRRDGAALLVLDSLDLRALSSVLSHPRAEGHHLPGVPRPAGELTLGAALDRQPLLALYAAPHAQLSELQRRLEKVGARTLRGGKDALYASLGGPKYLLVESEAGGKVWLVVLRLPD